MTSSQSASSPRQDAGGRNATADRAIDILMLFNDEHPLLTAIDVSETLGLSRSATYRYLQTLRVAGLIEAAHRPGSFRLGPRIFELARTARRGLGLLEVALPVMHDIAEKTREAVVLTRRSGNQAVFIEYIDSWQSIRLSHQRGLTMPLHSGAAAKILLANMSAEEIDEFLTHAPLARPSERTETDPDRLRQQLETIRAEGYVVTAGEYEVGAWGVAAPVFGSHGDLAAGLCISGPEFRMNQARLPELIEVVCEGARVISRRLRDVEES